MPNSGKRISPTFTDSEYEQIRNIALRENRSMSEVVRLLAKESLGLRVTSENLDFITTLLRREIKNVQEPGMERLASLLSKTCVMAATAAYLNAETVSRLLPPDKRSAYKEVYDAARVKAVQYTRSRYPDPDTGEE